jgi:hypothetical protein
LTHRKLKHLSSTIGCVFGQMLISLLVVSQACAQENTADFYLPGKTLAFAEWLYHTDHDYGRAGDEYARYLFLTQVPNDSVEFRLAMCREKEGKLSTARELFGKVGYPDSASSWRCKALFQQAYVSFLMGEYPSSLSTLGDAPQSGCAPEQDKFRQLRVFDFLVMKKWDSASAAIKTGETSQNRQSDLVLRMLLEQGKNLPHRSPFLAAGLSTLVPGLGKVYTSEWEDGLYSFVYVALTGYLSYTGFESGGVKSWKGWIFGGISGVLYAGNIYGSAKSAQTFNVRIETNFLDGIKKLCDLVASGK